MNLSSLLRCSLLTKALGKAWPVAWLGALALPACGESPFFGSAPVQSVGAPILHLLPEVFVGQVPCRPGEPRNFSSYAVDLVDPTVLTDAGVGSPLGSSIAVRCDREVEFSVPSGRPFALRIRAYDVSAEQVRAAELDAEPLQPRWRAQCGGPELLSDAGAGQYGPIVSIPGRLYVRSCTTLEPTAPTQAEVRIAEALGELQCGQLPGQVDRFTAQVDGLTRSAPCDGSVLFDDLSPGSYAVVVSAQSASGLGDAGTEVGDAAACAAGSAAPDTGDAGAGGADASVAADAGAAAVACPEANPVTTSSPQWATTCALEVIEGRRTVASCGELTPL